MNDNEKVTHSNYRPEIDGLRAVSVLAVILFHANLFMSGGYVGVDIFFVISGFLITSIIFAEIEQDRFNLIVFWERRVRRIFPAVALMQIVVVGLGILLYLPQDLDTLFKSSIYLSCNLPNVNYWRSVGYFNEEASIVKPLLHTWSLGVEEQFYIVYPIAIALLYRYFRRRAIVFVLFSLGVISFCSNIYQSYFGDTAAAFYLLPARTWELMSGCLLVFVNPFRNRSKLINESVAILGIAMMMLSMILLNDKLTFPGFWAVPPVLGACLFIGSNTEERTRAGNALSAGILVMIGKISFSLYLWHWPLIVFPELYFPDFRSLRLTFVALAFPLSYYSWKYVEAPIRRKRILSTPKSIFRFYVMTTCLLIALAVFGIATKGMSFRTNLLPERIRGSLTLENTPFDPLASSVEMTKREFFAGKRAYLGDRSSDPPKFLVWGDSHAMSLASSFARACKRKNVYGWILAQRGTPPMMLKNEPDPIIRSIRSLDPNRPADEVRSVLRIMNANGIDHLILVFRWDLMPDSQKIAAFLDLIGEISPNTKVFVVDQFPKQKYTHWHYQAALVAAIGDPFRLHTTDMNDYSALRAHIVKAMSDTKNPNAIHIPVGGDCFDSNGHSRFKEGNRIFFNDKEGNRNFYNDDDHLSAFGAERLFDPIANRMMDMITGIQE